MKAGFEASGAFFEKGDADARGKRGAGGEYDPQDDPAGRSAPRRRWWSPL